MGDGGKLPEVAACVRVPLGSAGDCWQTFELPPCLIVYLVEMINNNNNVFFGLIQGFSWD